MKLGYRQGIICSNIEIATNIYEMKIRDSSPMAQNDKGECHPEQSEGSHYLGCPGQFYMLKSWDLDPFLSRPISIANIEEDKLVFLYEAKGKGTDIFSKLKIGDNIELLGPLGNGFNIEKVANKTSPCHIAIIAGGIGIAPMVYLAKKLQGKVDFYCGLRDEIYYIDIIKEYVDNIYISTESGSHGHKGFVTELFVPEKYDLVYTCGPAPMMKRVIDMAKSEVFVSMESRMACGIGACLGCTIQTKSGMKRVCKEGPVFSGKEVIFLD